MLKGKLGVNFGASAKRVVVLSSEFGVVLAAVITSLFIGFVVPPESRVIKIGRDKRCFMAQGS